MRPNKSGGLILSFFAHARAGRWAHFARSLCASISLGTCSAPLLAICRLWQGENQLPVAASPRTQARALMGVSRLWDLLAPCGRRVSLESLSRKRLAVDASIWLIQFIKAMRDDSGEMLQNAPVLGLFRRLCKLLFLHIYPVLVFDGATPPLKQKTVARRRAFRERQESSLRRTAEKILLNQVSTSTLAQTRKHARTHARTQSPTHMHTRARTCARAHGFLAAAPWRCRRADEGSPPSPRAGG